MAKRGKIERACREAEVLMMARKGMGSRAISKELAKGGLKVSHTAVSRFLTEESEDRTKARRATTAVKAAEVAGRASDHADDNQDQMQGGFGSLALMVNKGVRKVGGVADVEEYFEVIKAEDQVRAAGPFVALGKYLIELAAENPRPVDARSTEAIRSIISEVYGYANPTPADQPPGATGEPVTVDPMDAPPSPEEHQPPIMH